MEDLAALIEDLRARGVSFWAEAGRLRWRGPPGAVSAEQAATFAAREGEAVKALRAPRAPISPRVPGTPIPLSFMQERMFGRCDRLSHVRDIRLGAFALDLEGAVDPILLERALLSVVERHEALRTKVVRGDEGPYVVLDPVGRHALAIAEVSEDDAAGVEQAFIDEISAWGEAAPLFAAKLLLRPGGAQRLLIGWHHIIYDAVAVQVVVREIFDAYAALATGQSPPFAPLPLQFTDFAAWQRGEAAPRHEAFWTETLRDAAPIAPPQDASGVEAYLRGDLPIPLSDETARAMRAASQEARTFLPLVGATAAFLALGEWSGQDDLVLPFQYFGRDRPELENLVGCLAYPLHLRVRLKPGEAFAELLTRVASEYWAVCRHPDYGRIAMEQGAFLDAAHFNWLSGAPLHVESPGAGLKAALRPVTQSHMRLASIHMSVLFFDDGEHIRGHLSYRADLFSRPTLEALAGRMTALLDSLAS